MKKLFTILAIVGLMVAFASCKNNNEEVVAENTEEVTAVDSTVVEVADSTAVIEVAE